MALSIKTEEADRLARELASVTDETLTQAVTVALRERLERVQRDKGDDFAVNLAYWQDRLHPHRIDDPRTDDEIIGYDEFGLPS